MSNQPPDLASILQTLASLAPAHSPTSTINAVTHRQESAALPVPVPAPASRREVINPATILDWPGGLRCVMKTVAQNEQILGQIRQMMKTQHAHEEQWWQGRVALVEKQAARVEGQKKLEEMLRAVGSSTPSGSSGTSPEELAAELTTYDMKVHRAQMQMVEGMHRRLQQLGVPFFGVPDELVMPAQGDEQSSGQTTSRIERGELLKLQRRMLGILEDLCED